MMDSAATAVSGGGIGGGHAYPDSVESSPRSRAGEPWDDPFSSAAGGASSSRLRLMCSYGGRIVPRPTDKSLCYLGGETRIVVVDRQSSLAELTAKLSRSLLSGCTFSLKYQLPNEDLDSLISVTTDEDLENMIEEYDRLAAASSAGAGGVGGVPSTSAAGAGGAGGSTRSNRLRLFLFPAKSESAPASTIGSLLDESKSSTWFVDALNSAMDSMGMDGLPRGFSVDATSVNCLLGLEDDSSVHSRGGAAPAAGSGVGSLVGLPEPEKIDLPRPDSYGKLARHGQDVHSMPDSPMLDTTSSFGSASSAPFFTNLPPIRLRPDERPPDPRMVGLDDHFAQMILSSAAATAAALGGPRMDEGYKEPVYAAQNQPPSSVPLHTGSAATSMMSPTENSNRNFSSDDEKSDHGVAPKLQQPLPKPAQLDSNMTDSVSRPMYLNVNTDPRRDLPVSSDPSYRIAMPVSDSAGYIFQPEQFYQPQPLPNIQHHQQQQQQPQPQQQQQQLQPHPQQQPQQPQPHPQQQPQQQYIQANPHYFHHTATGTILPFQSYYPIRAAAHPIQQTPHGHSYDQQIPMYYLPAHPQYNLATMQPALMNPSSIPTAGKPSMAVSRVTGKPELQTSLYNTAVAAPSPATLQPPLIHMAGDQAHSYAGMGYHVVQPNHLSQTPAAMANYGYEYAADPANSRVYYSQATSPPALSPQYQMVNSTTVTGDAMSAASDSKAARAS